MRYTALGTSSSQPFNSGIIFLFLALLGVTGCHTTNPHQDNTPPVYRSMPKELSKVVLPEYTIEPPDILNIEGIHIVPKSPYYLRTPSSRAA